MNTDPVGTQGGEKKTAVNDLQLALDGGSEFATRLKQLADAKDQAKLALDSLGVGKDIKTSYAEAKKTVASALTEAEALRLQASNDLANAHRNAALAVKDAETKADGIIAEANSRAGQIIADAQQTKTAADAYADSTRIAADAIKKAAEEERHNAANATAKAQAAAADHADAAANANKSAQDAANTKHDYEARLAKIKALTAELGG
jgi:F0F1-type ATP synthase membrane subunit b/b'